MAVATEERSVVDGVPKGLYIGGEWRETEATIPVEDPATGEVIAEVGNRGRSTGPHLHIEVETPGGRTINPRPWLDEHGIGY